MSWILSLEIQKYRVLSIEKKKQYRIEERYYGFYNYSDRVIVHVTA